MQTDLQNNVFPDSIGQQVTPQEWGHTQALSGDFRCTVPGCTVEELEAVGGGSSS